MIIGVPRETKRHESRVGLTPGGVNALVEDGQQVLIESQAGIASGFEDLQYVRAGASIVGNASELFGEAELLVKVKEPQPDEVARLRSGQVVFCYFHFAADRELTEGCLKSGVTALAYETLRGKDGSLPLLTPMSAIAGRLSVQAGAHFLERPQGGSGVLLGGVPGVLPGKVLVLGGGTVGSHAAQMALGLGAEVVICDTDVRRLRELSYQLPGVKTLVSDPFLVEEQLKTADVVIGAVLVPGQRAPHLVRREQLPLMKKGSVIVDVCIDQGGCFETSRPTTYADPTYVEEGVIHYMVTNMPGAVPQTSTRALTNATFPYVRKLAHWGLEAFLNEDLGHAAALNLSAGVLRSADVALAFPDLPALLPS